MPRRLPRRSLPWLGAILRLVVGGVWIAAAVLKLPHPEESVAAVRAYQLLPIGTTTFVGHLLPVVEVVVGAILVLGLLTRFAGVVSALLLVGFVVGIVSVWSRAIAIDCGCFGGGGADPDAISKYPWEIARDVALFAASAYLVVGPRSALALDTWLFPRTPRELDREEDSDVEVRT
jgi:uncharacterized membrane protein YphA (DoxX/SURF4 family)